MSQSSRHRVTSDLRARWRLAGDVACLLLHGSVDRPRGFAPACIRFTFRGKPSSPAPAHDYSAHVRGRFDHLRALIFLGEPFDGGQLVVSLELCMWKCLTPQLAWVRLELLKYPQDRLTWPEPPPQLRYKLAQARPAVLDDTRRDQPAYWVAGMFEFTQARKILGSEHPAFARHDKAMREAVRSPLHTKDGPHPTPTRGPHHDGQRSNLRYSIWPQIFRTTIDTVRHTYDAVLWGEVPSGLGPSAESERAAYLHSTPQSFNDIRGLLAHVTGVEEIVSFEPDHARYVLAVAYRGAAHPVAVRELLNRWVPAVFEVHINWLSAPIEQLTVSVQLLP